MDGKQLAVYALLTMIVPVGTEREIADVNVRMQASAFRRVCCSLESANRPVRQGTLCTPALCHRRT